MSTTFHVDTHRVETHRQRPPVSGLLVALPTSAITAIAYFWWSQQYGVPRPGNFVGLALGGLGFLLMIAAETLYTLRKRLPKFHYGRMAAWLQGHIFAGFVGPVLVLLHGAGKFHGLAGITAALTITMVVSGFVGRYLYTAIPRSLDGAELGLQGLFARSAEVERRLQSLGVQLPADVAALWNAPPPVAGWRLVLLRSWVIGRHRQGMRRAVRGWKSVGPTTVAEVRRLLEHRYLLQVELQSLASLRRLSALWHAAHVPLGVVLFTLAVVHVAAALVRSTVVKPTRWAMFRLLPTTTSALLVAGTLGLTTFAYLMFGTEMFNPGGLNAEVKPTVVRGGVRSHAETAENCSACHAPPFSTTTMADRCLLCHVEVRGELVDRRPLHGTLGDANECQTCHTEHHGPLGTLTSFAHFNHDRTSFPLTGMHAAVACAACHKERVYKGTSQSCVSCHADPPVHRGRFGLNCARCHSTTTWRGATFAHSFPLNHGGGGKKAKDCAVCHQQSNQYRSYTCYGCHRHDPEKTAEKHLKWNIVELAGCSKCHPTGRKRPDLPPKHKIDDLTASPRGL